MMRDSMLMLIVPPTGGGASINMTVTVVVNMTVPIDGTKSNFWSEK